MPFNMGGGTAPMAAGRYIAQVIEVRDGKVLQHGPTMDWIFRLWYPDGTPVEDEATGSEWELWELSSDKLSKGKNVAKARAWADALYGGDIGNLSAAEIGSGLAGRTMWADITINGDGYGKIEAAYVYDAPAEPAPATAPAPAPAPVLPEQPALAERPEPLQPAQVAPTAAAPAPAAGAPPAAPGGPPAPPATAAPAAAAPASGVPSTAPAPPPYRAS